MGSYASAEEIKLDVAELLRPPKRISVADGAAASLMIDPGSGAYIPWDPNETPNIIEPMNCLNSRQYDVVCFVGPARDGKTMGLVDGWITYCTVYDPADMLVVQITEEKAREYRKKRLGREFMNSPDIRAKLSPRRHDNNVHDIVFRAGNYLKIGWPSNNTFASSDFKYVALTDYDRLSLDIGGEGDGFKQAKKRTTTFGSTGMTMVESSPGHEVPLEHRNWKAPDDEPHIAPPVPGILSIYNAGDRRRLYWQCPHCGEWFMASCDWLKYDEEIPDPYEASHTAFMLCPKHGCVISADLKHDINMNHRWLREGLQIDCDGVISGRARESRIASFWKDGVSATYQTWQSLVYEYLLAMQEYEMTGSQEKLKTHVNVDRGLPYLRIDNAQSRDPAAIQERVEQLTKKTIPRGVRFITANIDVQAGSKKRGKSKRFVVQVIGYGVNRERWLIDRFNIKEARRKDEDGKELPIDPAGHLEDWDVLIDRVIERSYPLADNSGRQMKMLRVSCDSGGEDGVTDNAYSFYRKLKRRGLNRRFYLVKGASPLNAPKLRETYPDNTDRKDRKAKARGDVPVQLINPNLFKDTISADLGRETPGPGYIHFPDWLGQWFFEELTAEVRKLDGRWECPGNVPNEATDLFCYGDMILMKLKYHKINWESPPPWARDWDENPEVVGGVQSPLERKAAPAASPRGARRSRGRTR